MEEYKVVPDGCGLYSLCFRKSCAKTLNRSELAHEFGAAGNVHAVDTTDHMVFIRYNTVDEALNCLEMFQDQYDIVIAKNNMAASNTRKDDRKNGLPTKRNRSLKQQRTSTRQFDECSSISDTSSSGHSSMTMTSHRGNTNRNQNQNHRQMPELETEYPDMPPLIHDSDLNDADRKYAVESRIFVGKFPDGCPEADIEAAFSDYHVVDVEIVNNHKGPLCTKAFLSLETIYDAVLAVKEMNKSRVFGSPIQVKPSHDNEVLRRIVNRSHFLST